MGAGVLAGAVTGPTLVVTGVLPPRADPALTLVSCYENGREIGHVSAGKAMLVTAKSADGTWLELYLGVPGADRGWAPRSALRIDSSIDALPVGTCLGFVAFATL